jgi:uncharacterized protein (DUF2147 family)
MRKIVLLILFTSIAAGLYANNNADAILGTWINSSGKGHIQIFKQSGKYYGKIIWLKNPNDESGKPKVDRKNPNQDERSRRLLGLVVLRDFKYEDDEWKGGKIYNPEDGKEYKCYMKLTSDKRLSVRGYIGFSLLGKTETFTRLK